MRYSSNKFGRWRPAPLASAGKAPHCQFMANILAFLFGLVALVFALIGFIPFFGLLLWPVLLIAGIGAIFGFVSSSNSGRNFCLVVMAICAIRLWLGGGIF
jgi:hypothetical protein